MGKPIGTEILDSVEEAPTGTKDFTRLRIKPLQKVKVQNK